MKHIFLLQAYGDNAISLYILKQFCFKNDYKVHGTNLTKEIIDIVGFEANFIKIFEKIPAFYNMRKDGVFYAIRDFFVLYRYIKLNIPINEELYFEKKDFRFKILSFLLTDYKLNSPEYNINVYEDRAISFCKKFDKNVIVYNNKKVNKKKSILINPTGRSETRHLNKSVLEELLFILKQHEISIYFVDYLGIYETFRDKVDFYYKNTSLKEAADILRNVDLYCGPDSLFLHLAFVLNKRFFCIMNYDSSYFLPLTIKDNYIILDTALEINKQISNFDKWLLDNK